MKHDDGCFCDLCMAADRVRLARKALKEAQRSLAALQATKPKQSDMRRTVIARASLG